MNISLIWNNLLVYSLQIGCVMAAGVLLARLFRHGTAGARLLYWQLVLLACLALPILRPWQRQVVAHAPFVASSSIQISGGGAVPAVQTISLKELALWLLLAGVLLRIFWIAAGMVRLSIYRRNGAHYAPHRFPWPVAQLPPTLIARKISGPVTFGFLRPVVLLPESFPDLPLTMREAMLCHEFLHVTRGDWLFNMAEELLGAALWFHPAIWFAISEIQLAREQCVDECVVEMTQSREGYVDTLLAMASACPQDGLASAMSFLRKRHLKKRLFGILEEIHMSKKELISGCTAALVAVGAACWLVTGVLPLTAAPQAGVTVNTDSAQPVRQTPVVIPADVSARGIQGTVAVQVRTNAAGDVSDASVISGPEELRKPVLRSVLDWHFDKSEALATKMVTVDFAAQPQGAATDRVLRSITYYGLAETSQRELTARLRPFQDQSVTSATWNQMQAIVRAIDPDLVFTMSYSRGQADVRISVHGPAAERAAGYEMGKQVFQEPLPPGVYRAGDGVSAARAIATTPPSYPDAARADRVTGEVFLSVIIGADGFVHDPAVVRSLDPRLDASAIDAVRQWRFAPAMKDGVPVSVQAQIGVSFKLL